MTEVTDIARSKKDKRLELLAVRTIARKEMSSCV